MKKKLSKEVRYVRYFRLRQDERNESGLIMVGSSEKRGVREAGLGNMSLLEDLTVIKAYTFKGRLFKELLHRQVFMFKSGIKEVFDLYLPELEYRSFCIIDLDDEKILEYYHAPILKVAATLSPKSERPSLASGKLYLDKKLVQELDGLDIFRMAEPEKCIIVSLPVAESLLRRKLPGILLTHVEMV